MYSIKIDLEGISAALYEQVSQAVKDTANQGYLLWLESVRLANIPHDVKMIYTQSIDMAMVNDFKVELWTDYPKAAEIENGQPARDLKTMLQTSIKARVSKKGLKYLYIPFRHNTPGNEALAAAMPKQVYEQALNLEKSRILSIGLRQSQITQQAGGYSYRSAVLQRSYQWGGRLQAGLAEKAKPYHQTDLYAGMVRFDDSVTGDSYYMTFRTMSEKSSGWIVPAKPGLKITEAVATQVEQLLKENLAGING